MWMGELSKQENIASNYFHTFFPSCVETMPTLRLLESGEERESGGVGMAGNLWSDSAQ